MLYKYKILYDVTLTVSLYYWRVCEGTHPGVGSYRQLSSNYYNHVKRFTHEMFVGRKSEQINPPPPVIWHSFIPAYQSHVIYNMIDLSADIAIIYKPHAVSTCTISMSCQIYQIWQLRVAWPSGWKRQPVGRRRWAKEARRSHERVARPATCNGPAAVHFFTLTVLMRVKKRGMAW